MQHAACVATGRVTRRAATKGLGHPTPLVCRTNSNGPPVARSSCSTLAIGMSLWGGGDPTEPRHLSGRRLQGCLGSGAPSSSLGDWTPSSQGTQATPEGSPSRHILLLLPPSSPPLGVMRCRPRFETRILPRTAVVDAVEAELTSALVANGGSTRPAVTGTQVQAYLERFFQVPEQQV
jgi:hypothetical protein